MFAQRSDVFVDDQGGNCQRIVNCILGLKSYSQWKQAGGTGSWRYGSAGRHANTGKYFTRKNSEPFMGYLHRTQSGGKSSDISVDHLPEEHSNSTVSHFLFLTIDARKSLLCQCE